MSHTPGPWKWDMDGTRGFPVLYGNITQSGCTAVLGLSGERCYLDPGSPDGRLIELAPEMLEELKAAESWLYGLDSEGQRECRARIGKLIAKAGGKTSQ